MARNARYCKAHALLGFTLSAASGVAACQPRVADTPFPHASAPEPALSDAAAPSDTIITDDELGPRSKPIEPTLGGRCLEDAQCDDGVDCTVDRCDLEIGRCRATPDDSLCQDTSYCNGNELCAPASGCIGGDPVTCDDQTPCTIDHCNDSARSCEHVPRDVDGDGDVDRHCSSNATDCDDQNPEVSGLHAEVCGNGTDDDCDGQTDETGCVDPEADTCKSAPQVDASTTLRLELAADHANYTSTCGLDGARDAVVTLDLEPHSSVFVRADTEATDLALMLSSACGQQDESAVCGPGRVVPGQGHADRRVAVVGARDVDGPLSLLIQSNIRRSSEVTVAIEVVSSADVPDNEDCASARPIEPGDSVAVDLRTANADAVSRCSDAHPASSDASMDPSAPPQPAVGDLVYALSLSEPGDVQIFAVSRDPDAVPVLSLWDADCTSDGERACARNASSALFVRALPKGEYRLVVSATSPAILDLRVETASPTSAPVGDVCSDAIDLSPDEPRVIDLADYSDDAFASCSPAGRDVLAGLELDEASDVLLRARTSDGDRAALAFWAEGDACPGAVLGCSTTDQGTLRSVVHGLGAGSYRWLVDSELANPVELLWLARPSRPLTIVTAADACESALQIPALGGSFSGDTTRAQFDEPASCDIGGASIDGTPDQWLHLALSEQRRVVFDTRGSEVPLILNLRRGTSCPGKELDGACVIDAAGGPGAYLERVLSKGDYWVQLLGYAGARGRWTLDVFTDRSK
ncbi:MAG TPA: putative metal-binding motif-containing protein [Polyangiaceae bacterium]|nr:putative metal-binding motif-containing protein [Polyangiaceae bacterium]